MSDFYGQMQGVASDLLKDFKQGVIQYVALTPGNGPADNPGAPTEVVHTDNAVARGVSFKYNDRTNDVASDLQITMPGDGVAPDMKGFVRVDDTTYKIIRIIRNPAAGTPVAWVVIFRK